MEPCKGCVGVPRGAAFASLPLGADGEGAASFVPDLRHCIPGLEANLQPKNLPLLRLKSALSISLGKSVVLVNGAGERRLQWTRALGGMKAAAFD